MRQFWSGLSRRAKWVAALAIAGGGWIVNNFLGTWFVEWATAAAKTPGSKRMIARAALFLAAHPFATYFAVIGAAILWIVWLAYRETQRQVASTVAPPDDLPRTLRPAAEQPGKGSDATVVRPSVAFVGARYVFVYRVFGGYELHDDDGYNQSQPSAALVAEFELDPRLYGKAPDVEAAQGRITFSQGGKVCERIGYACWLGEGAHASFRVGDTRSLLIVVRQQGLPISIDCTADVEQSNNLIARPLKSELYDVQITLLLKDGNYQLLAQNSFVGSVGLLDGDGKPVLDLLDLQRSEG